MVIKENFAESLSPVAKYEFTIRSNARWWWNPSGYLMIAFLNLELAWEYNPLAKRYSPIFIKDKEEYSESGKLLIMLSYFDTEVSPFSVVIASRK